MRSLTAMAERGGEPGLIAAWIGAVAYALQIFFDFSGYSDMALGLARCLGYRLPVNFNGPYKSASVVEFWRRWHITLSHFLRDHLYIPLGGNRHALRGGRLPSLRRALRDRVESRRAPRRRAEPDVPSGAARRAHSARAGAAGTRRPGLGQRDRADLDARS